MKNTIEFVAEKNQIPIKLNDTKTAQKLKKSLPLKAKAQVWGNEIYFSIPLEHTLEQGREVLEVGEVAYWPPGQAFCIFFGKTPASTDHKPRAAGPVTVIGRIASRSDIAKLKNVAQNQTVRLQFKQ